MGRTSPSHRSPQRTRRTNLRQLDPRNRRSLGCRRGRQGVRGPLRRERRRRWSRRPTSCSRGRADHRTPSTRSRATYHRQMGADTTTDTATDATSNVRAPFAPWDRRELPGSFDVAETARTGRQLQVDRDEAVRGARRMGRDRARARHQDATRHALLPPRLACRALAQAAARAPGDEARAADRAGQRGHGAVHHRDDRARGAGVDDREAGRRLPRADPAVHRGVHVPHEQHQRDHRCTDDPVVEVRSAGRIRGLARRRVDAAVVDHHPR